MTDILLNIPWWSWFVMGLTLGTLAHIYICGRHKDGTIHVKERPDKDTDVALFEFDISPQQIPSMKQVIFKVVIDPPEKDS